MRCLMQSSESKKGKAPRQVDASGRAWSVVSSILVMIIGYSLSLKLHETLSAIEVACFSGGVQTWPVDRFANREDA